VVKQTTISLDDLITAVETARFQQKVVSDEGEGGEAEAPAWPDMS
jgi:hypothetical protein